MYDTSDECLFYEMLLISSEKRSSDGCPKLDAIDYSEKLGEIIASNNIKSITVLRMAVPCCGGLTFAVDKALKAAKKDIPLNVVVIDTYGEEADK